MVRSDAGFYSALIDRHIIDIAPAGDPDGVVYIHILDLGLIEVDRGVVGVLCRLECLYNAVFKQTDVCVGIKLHIVDIGVKLDIAAEFLVNNNSGISASGELAVFLERGLADLCSACGVKLNVASVHFKLADLAAVGCDCLTALNNEFSLHLYVVKAYVPVGKGAGNNKVALDYLVAEG